MDRGWRFFLDEGRGSRVLAIKIKGPPNTPHPTRVHSHFPRTSAWEPSSACLLPAILVPCVSLLNWSFFFYYHPADPICFLSTTESRVSSPKSQQPRVSRHLSVFSVSLSPSSPTPVLPLSQAASPLRLVRQQCAFEPEVQYAPPSSLSSSAVLHLSSPLSSLFLHDTSSRQLALLAPSLLRRHRPASRLHRGSVRCCRGRQNPTPAARRAKVHP